MVLTVAPVTDITVWVRSSGLLIVLYVTGAVLLSRFVQWLAGRVTRRIDARSGPGTDVLRAEAAKHSHADVQRVREILQRVGQEIRDDEALGPLILDAPSVVGVESLEVDGIRVRMVARTLPGRQFDVGRELRSRVAVALQTAGIAVSGGLNIADPVGTP
jgi:hypothetical protein